jgi:hypothetical protein
MNFITDLTKQSLFEKVNFSEKQMIRYADQEITLQILNILYSNFPSFAGKDLQEFAESFSITDEQQEEIKNIINYVDSVLNSIEEKTYKKFMKKVHIPVIIKTAKQAINYHIDSSEFGKFLVNFFVEENKQKLLDMMSELKEVLSSQPPIDEVTKHFTAKGGDNKLDEKLELLKKYEITAESLNFEIDSLSLDELETKIKEFKEQAEFALNGLLIEELRDKLGAEKIEEEWGSYTRYSFVDFDSEKSQIYAFDRTDWKLYGFSFSKSGDSVTIDFATKKRCKFEIVDFVEGNLKMLLLKKQ